MSARTATVLPTWDPRVQPPDPAVSLALIELRLHQVEERLGNMEGTVKADHDRLSALPDLIDLKLRENNDRIQVSSRSRGDRTMQRLTAIAAAVGAVIALFEFVSHWWHF